MNLKVPEELNKIRSRVKELNQEFYDKEKFTEKLRDILHFQPFNEEIYFNLTNLLFKYGKSLSKQGKYNKLNLYYEIIVDDCLYKLTNCFKENNLIMIESLIEIIEKKGFNSLIKTENWKKLEGVNIQLANLNRKHTKLDLAISYYKNALKYSEKIGNKENISFLFEKIRKTYYQMENPQASIEDFNNIDKKYSRKKKWFIVGLAKKEIGNLFNFMEDYDSALTNYQAALNFFKNYNYINEVLSVKEKIGILLFKQKNFNDAIEYFKFIIDFKRKEGRRENIDSLFKKIGFYYKNIDKIEEAIENFEKFYQNALVKDYNIVAGYVKKTIGGILSKQENYNASIRSYKEAIVCFKKVDSFIDLAMVEMIIGNLFFHQKRYKDAENHYKLSFFYNEKIEFYIKCAISLIKLAKIYNIQGKFIKYLKTLLISTKFDVKNHRWSHIARTYINIGNYNYLSKGKVKKSINYYLISIFFHKKAKRWDQVTITYLTLGDIFKEQSEYKRSIKAYQKSINYCKKDKNCDRISETYVKIGNVLRKETKYYKAIKVIQKSLNEYEQKGKTKDIAHCQALIGDIYEEKRDFKESRKFWENAYENYDKYIQILLNDNKDKRLGFYYVEIGKLSLKLKKIDSWIDQLKTSIDFNAKHRFFKDAAISCKIIAEYYVSLKKYDNALFYCEKCLNYNERKKNIKGLAIGYSLMGDIMAGLGKFGEAIHQYEIALKKNKEINYITEMAILEAKIGNCFINLGNILGAIEYYKGAIEHNIASGDIFASAIAHSKVGRIYFEQKMYDKALSHFRESIKINYKNRIYYGLAIVYVQVGRLYSEINNLKFALHYFKISMKYNRKLGLMDNIAHTYSEIADIYARLNERRKSLKYLEKSLNLNENLENWEGYSKCITKFEEVALKAHFFDLKIINELLHSIEIDKTKGDWTGVCYRYLTVGFLYSLGNDYENAKIYYEKSLNNAIRNGLWKNIIPAHIRLSQFYIKKGFWTDAINHSNEVLEIDKARNNLTKIGSDYIHIGDIYFKWQKFEKALEYYEKALENDITITNEKGICISNAKLSDVYLKLGLREKSLTSLEKVLEYNEKTGEEEAVSKTKTKMGNLYVRLERYDDAMKNYIDALNIDLEKGNLMGIIISRVKIAKLHSIQGEFEKAIENYIIVLNYNKERDDKLSVYKTQSRIAYFYFNQGNWNKALQYYKDILQYLEEKREDIDSFYYFLNQSLRCKARISENKGDLVSVSKIYAEIAENYKQTNSYYYYYFYNLLTQFFDAELNSIKGDHQKSLNLLIDLEARFIYFMEYIENEPKRGSLYYLLNFRTKNVKANIHREKAFISVIDKEYEEASKKFALCAANYTNLIPKTYKQDYLLYNAIEEYYLGHSEWCNFKTFSKKYTKDYLSQARYLTKNVLNHFIRAEEIYLDLNQNLRNGDTQYEILLITGTKAALNNKIVDADNYYRKALLKLKQINKDKSTEFEKIFNKIRDLRRFPVDRFFLYIPSRGSSFMTPCNLVEKELKEDVIDYNINISSLFWPVNKDVDFTVDIQINSKIEYLMEEFYFLKVRGDRENVKVDFEDEMELVSIPFSLPFEKSPCSKKYFVDLLRPNKSIITSKELPIHFIEDTQDRLEDQFSKVVFEVFGKNMFKEIKNLIQKERFREIKDGLEIIYTRVNKYKIRSFIDIFKKLISAFSELFIFNFNIVKGLYVEVNKKIDSIFLDLTENEKVFFKNMKEEYIHWFLDNIQKYFKELKSDYNTRNIHPLVIEAYIYVIRSYNRNGKYPFVPQFTIAFFERIMNKIITEVHHLDYNNFDWNYIDLDEYKRLYSKSTGFPVESISIDPKISFMSGKTVLISLNAEFRKYSEKDENSKSLDIIRKARNDSPIEHGSETPTKDHADLCIKLIGELKDYNFGTPIFDFFNFFPKKMDLISNFIEFFEYNFIRVEDLPLDESNFQEEIEGEPKTQKIMTELGSIKSIVQKGFEDVREIKVDVKTGFSDVIQDLQFLKQISSEIKYEITDVNVEIKDFSSRFINPKIIETFTKFLIDTQKDKLLPPIKDVRVSTRDDRKQLKKAIDGWFKKFWYGMRRTFRLIRPIVFEFRCENEECKRSYRFIFYERTKISKVGLILLRIGGLTANLSKFITKYDPNFSLWIFKHGKFSLKSKIKTIRRSSNINPTEIQFLYRLLFGIEDEDSKRLSETFNLKIINDDIKFYCKNCCNKY